MDDLVEAVQLVLKRLPAAPGLQALHVGSGERVPNVQVARALCRLAERDERLITPVADRAGHDRRYALDSSKVRGLGWAPAVTFDEGIARTFRWYAENQATWSASVDGSFSEDLERQYAGRFARG